MFVKSIGTAYAGKAQLLGTAGKINRQVCVSFGSENNSNDKKIIRIFGEKGVVLQAFDKNNLFEIENISSPKVGSKFILKPKDSDFDGLRILFKPTSVLSSVDNCIRFSMSLPLSFMGRVFGSIRNSDGKQDEVMKQAYKDFWEQGMYQTVMETSLDKASEYIKDDYNFFIPSDGDGTRYKDVTSLLGGVTKPASQIPATLNGKSMKLVQAVLSNYTKTSKLDGGCDFIPVQPALGSAYAFLEGIAEGTIPTDKPLVFSWGDNFSDINVTNLILSHEKCDADLTLLTLPVTRQRIESLGAAKVKSQDDLTVSEFFEKPKDELADSFIIPGTTDKCLGVVGPYVLSPKLLCWIKENYTRNPEKFHGAKGFDFSEGVIKQLVELTKKGGDFKVTAYEKPETDTWSDLGAEKDFTSEMNNVKNGAFVNLPQEMRESISRNIDSKGNITFDSETREKFESFVDKYNLDISNTLVYYKK